MIRQVRSRWYLLVHSGWLFRTAACAAGLLLLQIVSSGNLQLYMVAGPRPEQPGGAIGFMANQPIPGAPDLAALRTALCYTLFWLPLSILLAAAMSARESSCHASALSAAKGTPPEFLWLAGSVSPLLCLALCYSAQTAAGLLAAGHSAGLAVQQLPWGALSSLCACNLLVLWQLSLEARLVFQLIRNLGGTVLALLTYHCAILIVYPSCYLRFDQLPWAGRLLVQSSPVYTLMNTCSLSFSHPPWQLALRAGAACLTLLAAGALVSHFQEEGSR